MNQLLWLLLFFTTKVPFLCFELQCQFLCKSSLWIFAAKVLPTSHIQGAWLGAGSMVVEFLQPLPSYKSVNGPTPNSENQINRFNWFRRHFIHPGVDPANTWKPPSSFGTSFEWSHHHSTAAYPCSSNAKTRAESISLLHTPSVLPPPPRWEESLPCSKWMCHLQSGCHTMQPLPLITLVF